MNNYKKFNINKNINTFIKTSVNNKKENTSTLFSFNSPPKDNKKNTGIKFLNNNISFTRFDVIPKNNYFPVDILVLNFAILHIFESRLPFDICITISAILYGILLNFFQCPIRTFESDTDGIVVAPADGKVVVVEETEENEYFHDRRIMVSIFMSLFNVHANWIPVDGTVKYVQHYDGNFHKAWLPKASEENERCTVPTARRFSPDRWQEPWHDASSPIQPWARSASSMNTSDSSSSARALTSTSPSEHRCA